MKRSWGKFLFIAAFFLGAWSLMPGACFSDSSSTNYALAEDRFTGGGGNASSSNYQVAETLVGSLSGDSISSTNYAVGAKVGINPALNIVSINSISPANYAKFFSDGNASYTVTAVDPDSDSLQYLAKQDSTTKVAAQSSNTLTWALSGADLGRHTNTLQVIDPDGTVLQQQSAYVARHPVK